MRIKNIMLGLLVGSAFGLVGCSDDDFSEFQSALTVTSAETSIEAAGGTKQIHVEGPLASVYTSASWLTVAQNGSVVNVTADVNPDVQSRNAIVVMKASESDSTIVNISQSGARVEFNLPEKMTVLAHGKSEATFDILHNIPVYTTPSDSWISAVVTEDAVTVYTEPNTTGGNREGYIDIETGMISKRIAIVQYDICGQYDVTATDFSSRPKPVSMTGKLIGGATGNDLLFIPEQYSGQLQIPMTFDASTNSIKVSAASYCGPYNNLYVYTVIVAGNTQSYEPESTISGLLESTDNGQFAFTLNAGEWNGTAVTGFRLRSFTEQNPVSGNVVREVLENFKTPTFVRVAAN